VRIPVGVQNPHTDAHHQADRHEDTDNGAHIGALLFGLQLVLQMVQIVVVYIQLSIIHTRRLWIVERLVDRRLRFLDCCVADAALLWTVVLDGRFGHVFCVIVVVALGAERWTLSGFGDLGLVTACGAKKRGDENTLPNKKKPLEISYFSRSSPDASCLIRWSSD
jgi:hypothetical protein